ncbi:hypothetical protein [Novosphingobium sp. 9U]|uniref:hypothetical protein n=1 Tax=Novosphingobium sp. 9U TaxID=2653158 RepID=UPI0012F30AFF|nr:hypothetical protein [Novosphingobium sp. 9U]VWX51234.1 conserved exported hypothetical protein [Novosphingobium sp. 9U]
MKKSLIVASLAAVSMTPLAAHAQAAPAGAAPAAAPAAAAAPTVGAKVFDTQGGEVGSIEKLDGTNAVVFTGTKRATLPVSAIAKSDKGLVISMTKAQLEAAVAAAETKTAGALDTALVADAKIKSKDGQAVGTVQKVEGENVTVALADGNPVTVTKQYLTAGADGSLTLTMNAAEFKSAVAAASQSAATAPAGADAKANTNTQAAATDAPAGN